MITINAVELHEALKVNLGVERAQIVVHATMTELQRTEAWVEMSLRDFEMLNVGRLSPYEEEFSIDGQTYKSKPVRRAGRIAGHRVYKLHRGDNYGRVIRGWFGRILNETWGLINPSEEERAHMFQVINQFVQQELSYPDGNKC